MQTEDVIDETLEGPLRRFDYKAMAESYNALEPGKVLVYSKVSNITRFKQALARHGLKPGVDVQAWHPAKRNILVVKRLTEKTMD